MKPAAAALDLAGRALIAGLFLAGVAQKTTAPAGAQDLLALAGWPVWLVWPATAFTLAAGLAVLLGLYARPAALR